MCSSEPHAFSEEVRNALSDTINCLSSRGVCVLLQPLLHAYICCQLAK